MKRAIKLVAPSCSSDLHLFCSCLVSIMRAEIEQLLREGRLPPPTSTVARIQRWQECVEKVTPPVSDEEAAALTSLFPPDQDECFGLAWSLVHLIETAPGWPLKHCLQDKSNPWIKSLIRAAKRRKKG